MGLNAHRTQTGRSPTILVVDHNRDQRRSLEAALAAAGLPSVLFAESAEEALQLLTRVGPRLVDLVLLDLKISGMDAVEACRRIRKSVAGAELPVIMLTADESDERLEAAFSAGATDYIQKPVRRTELTVRIRAALRFQAEVLRRRERERELIATTQQLEAMNESLLRLSLLDALTGIANRRCFDHALNEMWAECGRDNLPLSLLLMDVDLFKSYNDYFGHAAGDSCLREVAACLARSSRRKHDFVARYGGEEFAVLLPGADLQSALDVAERLREAVLRTAIPHAPSAPGGIITMSTGVASLMPCGETRQEQLVRSADEALYGAKSKGRNCVIASMAATKKGLA